MMTLSITVEDLISFNPCYTGDRLAKLIEFARSRDRWTALDIVACEQYSMEGRLWLLLRPELVPQRTLHELACDFASHAMSISSDRVDPRSVNAISVKRRWLAGATTDEELAAAQAAAGTVQATAARAARAAWAAEVAADVDARRAARRAAWHGAGAAAAAWDAERRWQLDRVVEVLSTSSSSRKETE